MGIMIIDIIKQWQNEAKYVNSYSGAFLTSFATGTVFDFLIDDGLDKSSDF